MRTQLAKRCYLTLRQLKTGELLTPGIRRELAAGATGNDGIALVEALPRTGPPLAGPSRNSATTPGHDVQPSSLPGNLGQTASSCPRPYPDDAP